MDAAAMASLSRVSLQDDEGSPYSTPLATITDPTGDMKRATVAPAVSEDDEKAARTIEPKLQRAAVRRSLLQRLAKWLGIHLEGAVATNEVSTAKYTIITFLPVNLFEQFLRVANLYFLLCAVLQLIPKLSPTSWFTTVAPLVFVLAVNAIKEGFDDYNRHKNDNQLNSRVVLRLTEQGEVPTTWRDVVAGDVLKVQHGEEIPADMILVGTADEEKLCYVETANLDGETNLKIKYAWAGAGTIHTVDDMRPLTHGYQIGCEAPNPRLYVFDGFVRLPDGAKEPLTADNLLLRGCTLRKTSWVIGVAVSVGRDTKIVQNMTRAPRKVTQLEQAMNWLVLFQFCVMLTLSAIMAGLDQWWQLTPAGKSWYLGSTGVYPELPPSAAGWVISLLRFLILFSNFIPISLYVTLEVVKVMQCTLTLNQDREMYWAENDTPFVCRTTTLNEELGQVGYVLSDKTGTLTQNVMGFVWASVDGQLYGRNWSTECLRFPGTPINTPHSLALDLDLVKALGFQHHPQRPTPAPLHRFLLHLALCNTVVPTTDDHGVVHYQAASPDEEALVIGAAYLGYRLISRSNDQAIVEVNGTRFTYQILATLEFNSDRKRMSSLVRDLATGHILLLTKGADSMMLARATPGQPKEVIIRAHLDEMSRNGYRTLVMAERALSQADFESWMSAWSAAQVAMDDREAKMADLSAQIEMQLELVGATAVEDKLQEGVPECLQALSQAGIKTWVLTGDKVETAVSIAHNCRLFNRDMLVLELRESDFAAANSLQAKRQVLQEKSTRMYMGQQVGAAAGAPRSSGSAIAALSQPSGSSPSDSSPLSYKAGWPGSATSSNGVRARSASQVSGSGGQGAAAGAKAVGMVVEGGALGVVLESDLQDEFMALCKGCSAVVCCRVSPMQKAQVVLMVKRKTNSVTLGIGDGANDVGMIRAAHIGVGISGREGRAAVLSSDFSFAQFKFLSRLLLLHGRWSYMRNVEVVKYSFYKNLVNTLTYVYLQCVAGFSAVPIFTTGFISTFNPVFTALPIVVYAVLEQDLTKALVLSHPATYGTTRTASKQSFMRDFLGYMALGAWHSLVVYFLPMYTLGSPGQDGRTPDLAAAGSAVFISVVLVVTLKLSLRTHCWTWLHYLIYSLSVVLLFPFTWVLGICWPQWGIAAMADMADAGQVLFMRPVFWLGSVLLVCGTALLPDMVYSAFTRLVWPTLEVHLQLRQYGDCMRGNSNDARPARGLPLAHNSAGMLVGAGGPVLSPLAMEEGRGLSQPAIGEWMGGSTASTTTKRRGTPGSPRLPSVAS